MGTMDQTPLRVVDYWFGRDGQGMVGWRIEFTLMNSAPTGR